MRALTLRGLERLAERDGFLVAYPEGIEHPWFRIGCT